LNPSLSILISSEKDLQVGYNASADIFFQLPDSLGNDISKLVELFQQHKQINPWFPSVLIGEDFDAAVEFLHQSRPKKIVTNNTGIAYEAWKLGIPWIAGPNLNLVNSFGLLCLKENFNCSGAFLSNELNKHQIRGIKRPDEFDLFYSIFHPIELMTSRQCLFHQVTGCHKERVDNECIQSCTKSTSITNLKNVSFFIDKTRGTYNRVYNEHHYLNTEIAFDVPDLFSSFLIDLRKIETVTKAEVDNTELIRLFEDHLKCSQESTQKLDQVIGPSTNTQYQKGI
jgi:putative protease